MALLSVFGEKGAPAGCGMEGEKRDDATRRVGGFALSVFPKIQGAGNPKKSRPFLSPDWAFCAPNG